MKNFSKIVEVLVKLIRKRAEYEWTEDCNKAFKELKHSLSMIPVFTVSNDSSGMKISSDASGLVLGYVLTQHDPMITFALRQVRSLDKNYPTHDLKFTIVIFILKIWRHYLVGQKV